MGAALPVHAVERKFVWARAPRLAADAHSVGRHKGGYVTEETLHAQIKAANAYEALFVPALFGQWAPKVADAARIQPGQRVLDVACGTGVLAREVVLRTGSASYIAGLDPSPGMLAGRFQRRDPGVFSLGNHPGRSEATRAVLH